MLAGERGPQALTNTAGSWSFSNSFGYVTTPKSGSILWLPGFRLSQLRKGSTSGFRCIPAARALGRAEAAHRAGGRSADADGDSGHGVGVHNRSPGQRSGEWSCGCGGLWGAAGAAGGCGGCEPLVFAPKVSSEFRVISRLPLKRVRKEPYQNRRRFLPNVSWWALGFCPVRLKTLKIRRLKPLPSATFRLAMGFGGKGAPVGP